MKNSFLFIFLTAILLVSCGTKSGNQFQKNQGPKIELIDKTSDKRIDIMIDGKLFTSYCWPDNVYKPILYPVLTAAGTEITRGFPIKSRTGERADHPHQTGMWLTYGNVNGTDFWGNGSEGLGIENENGGVIKHLKVENLSGGIGAGFMVTVESWTDKSGKELLAERTEYYFSVSRSTRIIDRITTLTASNEEISMPDTKEGMFGIRVARQLELPSEGEITLYSADGPSIIVSEMSNEGISGNYRSSEGAAGLDVWGTRAEWMHLYGNIGDEKISLVICDHPENPNYPTYWHARGYGLFSANPLGSNDFTKGAERFDFRIPTGQSVTFRYRVILSSGIHLDDTDINAFADDFARVY
jgi:hypothetical protein